MYTRRPDDNRPPDGYCGNFIRQNEPAPCEPSCEHKPERPPVCEPVPSDCQVSQCDDDRHQGLLGGLFSRFRGLEFDDLLLIGLLILLWNERGDGDGNSNEELLILLGILLLTGF